MNRTYTELMESLNADLNNNKVKESININEEEHYLKILEGSYGQFLDTFRKYMKSAKISNHSDTKRVYANAQQFLEEIKKIRSNFNLNG